VRKSLLKANAPLFEWLLRLFDPLLAILAGWLAYRWYLGTWVLPERYLLALISVGVFCFALFPLLRLYAPQRGVTLFEESRRLVNAWLLLAAAWFGYLFLSKAGADFSRAWSLYWIGFGVAMHFAFRAGIRFLLRALRRRGYNLRYASSSAPRLAGDISHRLALRSSGLLSARPTTTTAPRRRPRGRRGSPRCDQSRTTSRPSPVDQTGCGLRAADERRIREPPLSFASILWRSARCRTFSTLRC
jgi:hypothetical protein